MKKSLSGLIPLLGLTLLLVQPAAGSAQEMTQSVLIDPVKETIQAQPGESETVTLSITNESTESKAVDIRFAEFTVNDIGVPREVDASEIQGHYDWFSAAENDFVLTGGEQKSLEVRVDVPASAEEMGYYVSALVTVGPENAGTSSNESKQEIQVLYSLIVGTPTESLTIAEIDLVGEELQVVLKNDSDVHVATSGKVDLLLDGTVAESYGIPSTNVFPGKSRLIRIAVDPLDRPEYRAKVTLAYGADNRIITGETALDADALESDPNAQAAAVSNTVTVVQTNDNPDWLMYALIGIGVAMVGGGAAVYLKKR